MTWEGGMREPGIAWWPGRVPAASIQPAVTSTMDLFATALAMAGLDAPDDRIVDGRNLLPLLTEESSDEVRDAYFFYRGTKLYAVRMGSWKAHFITQWAYEPDDEYTEHDPPLLFDLDHDPSEQFNLAEENPEVIARIREAVEVHQAEMVARPTQLEARLEPAGE
jgi:arylsulfatase A-like enzyme